MSLTVAIPSHPLYEPLVENAESVCLEQGWRLLRGTEQECGDWLGRHIAEIALVTPVGYAQESYKTDYRILPAQMLAVEGLTYTGSIYIRGGAEELQRCSSPAPTDFLMKMGAVVLSEKFDIAVELFKNEKPTEQALQEYEVAIDYGFDERQPIVLDISDEWYDYVQTPLPLAFWVCRPDDMPENVLEFVSAMKRQTLPDEERVQEQEHNGTNAEREGRIIWRWGDDIERALQKTIEMLFYWQHVTTISATKVWQRESSHPLQS